MENTHIQRNYKDSLFRMIFRNKEELLSLYNAVNGSRYQDPEELQIRVLEDVIYMGMKNDVSFLFDDYLNLYEAQSTWNPNMPLRDVFYLADLYKGYIEENGLDIYSGTQLHLPTPRCIVFYNGMKKIEDRVTVRLSDSFNLEDKKDTALECVVTYLNVNYGHNQEIMSQCRKLYEYSFLIDQIRRELKQGKTLKAAVQNAVDYCIRNGILETFLRKHRAEVTNVILREYNEERHINNEKEISYQEGVEEGKKEGIKEGIREGSIRTAIEIYTEQGLEQSEICRKLIQKFQISLEQAEQCIKKYQKMK